MSDRVSPEALAVLLAADCEGDRVRLPSERLERAVYEEVNEVLTRLGGKWKRAGKPYPDGTPRGFHLFPYDPAPLLDAVRETGEMPPKNPTAFFPTPADVVAKMVEWAELGCFDHEVCRILEPSAGTGAIADAIRAAAPNARLDLVEVLPINASLLRHKGYTPHEGDFLAFRPAYEYDAVLMNPPFSLDGDPLAYITHILHAWSLLRDSGVLVAIAAPGFRHRSDARSRDFLAMVGEYGEWAELPAGTFKESGTGVATVILWMRKDNQEWKANPFQGWDSWHSWAASLWSESERDLLDTRTALFRRLREGRLPVNLFGAPEPETDKEIRAYYASAVQRANKHGEGIRPRECDWYELVAAFMAEYAEWNEYQDEKRTKGAA